MSPPRMVAEDPEHFTMDDGRRPFKVVKSWLSPTLAATIRSMSDVGAADAVDSKVKFGQQDQTPPQSELTRAAPFPQPLGMSQEESPVSPHRIRDPLWNANDLAHSGLEAARGTGAWKRLSGPVPASLSPDGSKFSRQLEAAQANLAAMSPREQEARARDPLMAQLNDATDTQRASTEQAKSLGIVPRGTAAAAPVSPPPVVQPPQAPHAAPAGIGGTAGMPGMSDIRSGTAAQMGAAQVGADAATEEGRLKAAAIGGYQTQLQAMALEDKARQDQARAKTEASMSAYRAASEEMRNISTTVDPGRYWASRSTGGKIASVIGLALGALGAGPDGINRAAGMIERAIDRDLDAQKAEHTLRLQQGRASVEAAQSAFAMQHQIFGDDLAAGTAARASLLGLADNELKKITAGAAGPQAQAQAQALSGALQAKQGELINAAANTAFDNNTARGLANAQLAAANAKPAIGVAEAKGLRDAEGEAQNTLDLIEKIRGGLKATSSVIPGKTALNQNFGADAATLATDSTALILAGKNLAKLGVLSDSDVKLLDKLIGDFSSASTLESTKLAKLDALEAMVLRSIKNQRGATSGAQAETAAQKAAREKAAK